VQEACSQLEEAATQLRNDATSANISAALDGFLADISDYDNVLQGKIGQDFDTLITDLKGAFSGDGNEPQLTGPVAPIQAALNQTLANCHGGGS
jgi:hypothetical protein